MRRLARRALVGLFLVAGCATTTQQLATDDSIPAASGHVDAKREGGNTRVRVEVKHLAPPPRVSPGAQTWVVWVRQLGDPYAPAQNVGVLGLDKDLRGRLETVTPFQSFDVFVTPEPSGTVGAPSGPELLSARIAPD